MRPTPRKPDRPVLWIVAGPNGSGKSSFYNRTDIEGWGGSVWIINPDLLTQQIAERESLLLDEANLAAVRRIEDWLYKSIEVYQTIGVETVLSSSKYRELVEQARRRGFEVRIIYIVLKSAKLQIERVGIRVSEGGHDVPKDKIEARRKRSFEQLAWFIDKADACYIYDNSTGEPEFLGGKIGDAFVRFHPLPGDLQHILDEAGVSFVDYPET
jgi:predicted ABC-type ATPase